ncbi:MAG: PIN domain-containing protein [Armatimonadota bacterium]
MTLKDPAGDRGLLDTSVFVARETGRAHGTLPAAATVSVVTIAELHLGVLLADDPTIRAQRLRTLSSVLALFEPLPIDSAVARIFAEIVAEARRQGKRPKIMDTWIAATALIHDLPVYTQDDDFLAIPRVRVIRV